MNFPKFIWVRRLERDVLPLQVSEIKLSEDMVLYERVDEKKPKSADATGET